MNIFQSDDVEAGRWTALMFICMGLVGALTTWFSATAIVPDLIREWNLSANAVGWLTNGVQLGFVIGAVAMSLFNLPDIIPMQRLIAYSAALAGAANIVLLLEPGVILAIAARIITGVALAGVYPPALKLMATWFVSGRGLALGFAIGALTLGSSMPHLFRALSSGLEWRSVVIYSSAATLFAALIFLLAVREGPHQFARAVFNPRQSLSVLNSRPLLLVNIGYFGHMWELYAMWAWILAFATAAEAQILPFPFGSASMLSFVIVASGVFGAILGGVLSDRVGRCYTTAGMMIVSSLCTVFIGFAFDGPGWMLAFVTIIWGMSIIGDSAQFSAAVTELSERHLVGTALTLQMGIGFALTAVAIWMIPYAVDWFGGWQWAFLVLTPGPVIGAWAMLTLRRMPVSARLAGGAR